jgi:hypothetical protein
MGKNFTNAGNPALRCLYLHVREYIVKYISEIKMYVSVTALTSVYLYILSVSLFRILNKEKL